MITQYELGEAYEFSAAQNEIIGNLATSMRIIGIVTIAGAVLQLVAALISGGYAGMIGSGITFVIGSLTFRSGNAFKNIVTSQGTDIHHLMEGLSHLRGMYRLQVWIIIIVAVIMIFAIIVVAVNGQ